MSAPEDDLYSSVHWESHPQRPFSPVLPDKDRQLSSAHRDTQPPIEDPLSDTRIFVSAAETAADAASPLAIPLHPEQKSDCIFPRERRQPRPRRQGQTQYQQQEASKYPPSPTIQHSFLNWNATRVSSQRTLARENWRRSTGCLYRLSSGCGEDIRELFIPFVSEGVAGGGGKRSKVSLSFFQGKRRETPPLNQKRRESLSLPFCPIFRLALGLTQTWWPLATYSVHGEAEIRRL